MKTLFLSLALSVVYLFAMAQDPDTTKIRMGNNKILIIKDQDEKKSNLNKGISDFQKKISELNDSIAQIRSNISSSNIQNGDSTAQYKIQEYEKKIAAYEKGIQQIESDLKDMENALNEENKNDDFDFDAGNWDFGNNKDDEDNDPHFDGSFGGMGFGLNGFLTKDFSMTMNTGAEFMELNNDRSWYFQFNPFEYNIGLYQDKIGLTTGMGFDWNYYAFDRNIKLSEDANGVIFGTDMPDRKFTKNHLRVVTLNIPLLLEFQLPLGNSDSRLVLGGGGFGSVKLHSRTKQYYEENGREYKDKISDDFQLNPLRYGLMAYVGLSGLRVTASYSMVPFFKNQKGPELYPFSIGLTFFNF